MAGAVGQGRRRVLASFAAFGMFWGTWGAVLPGVAARTGASHGALGLSLLCIGAGALVSMRATGALIDSFEDRVLPAAFAGFAAAAGLTAAARSPVALAGALLLLGGASGAVDVAINAEATGVETTGQRLLGLAHALFSAGVVAASGLVAVARSGGADVVAILVAAAVLLLATAVIVTRLSAPPRASVARGRIPWLRIPRALLTLGALTALTYLVENAWQSWSAVHLEDTLHASPSIAALGPATFGAAAATGRLCGHTVAAHVRARWLVPAGAALGGAGTLLGALAPDAASALAGIAVAGIGTSVCAPTLLSLAGMQARAGERGATIGIVTTLAYFGFLLAPVYVGLAAQGAGLRAALIGIAVIAALLAAGAVRAPDTAGADVREGRSRALTKV